MTIIKGLTPKRKKPRFLKCEKEEDGKICITIYPPESKTEKPGWSIILDSKDLEELLKS